MAHRYLRCCVRRKQDIEIQTKYTGFGHMEGIEDEIRI